MQIIPLDTTPEAYRIQQDVFRRMLPARRLQMACDLSDSIRGIAASGMRSRHPDYSDEQVKLAVIKLILGPDLFAKAYPGSAVQV